MMVAAKAGLAASAAMGLAMLAATPVGATISGPCKGTGYSVSGSQSKPADLAAAKAAGTPWDLSRPEWDVPSYKDWLAGEGSADGAMSSGEADVSFYGASFTVAKGSGSAAKGSGGPVSVAEALTAARNIPILGSLPPAKTVYISGSAVVDSNGKPPASGPCSGSIAVVFGDVDPANTTVGIGSIACMAVGIAAAVWNVIRLASGR